MTALPPLEVLPPVPTSGLLGEETLAQGRTLHVQDSSQLPAVGSLVSHLYYITDGLLRTFRLSLTGERKVLHLIGCGYFIFESYFFSQRTLQISCEVLKPLTLIRFEPAVAVQLMKQDSVFASRLMYSVASKMQLMGMDLVNLAYSSPVTRIKLSLAALADSPRADGCAEVNVSQSELGEIVGIHRVSVNRVLQQMRAEGLLSVGRGRIVLFPLFFADPELQTHMGTT